MEKLSTLNWSLVPKCGDHWFKVYRRICIGSVEIIYHFIYRLEHPQIWWEWWHPETNALRYKGTTVINPCELWEVGIEVHFPWRMSSGSNIICWKDFTFTSNLPWCLCQTSIDCICLVLSGLFLFLCEMGESVFVLSLLLGPNSRS